MIYNQTLQLLNKYKLAPNKRLGQNFLINRNVLEKIIVCANIDKQTAVVEIGCGLGNLTEFLLEKAGLVIGLEIDRGFIKVLETELKHDNFKLIEVDALKYDYDTLVKELKETYSRVIVVSNLPYYLTTPLLIKLTEANWDEMILMMQEEVTERLTAHPKTKAYGGIAVVMQANYELASLFVISPQAFYPQPKVNSAVLRVRPKDELIALDSATRQLILELFSNRRKTLYNNLTKGLQYESSVVMNVFEKLGISLNERIEALDVQTIIRLAKEL